MKVKLNTIMAGPDGCADAGQTVTVGEDLGTALIAGNFAEARDNISVGLGYEVEVSPQAIAAANKLSKPTKEVLVLALSKLDPTDDDDWTASGKPAMDRVKELTDCHAITRDEFNEMFPDFVRPEQVQNPPAQMDGAENTPVSGANQSKEKTVTQPAKQSKKPVSKPRSSAP